MVAEPLTAREQRFACPPRLFARHMRFLRSGRFNLVGLEEIQQHLEGNHILPSGSVAVTLDDGFQDNYEHAFPVLTEHRIPATIFVATGSVDSTNTWMSKEDFTRRRMLTWSQMRRMSAAGIVFGSHTVTHPRLTELNSEAVIRELRASKEALENGLDRAITHFAYPYGKFCDRTRLLVQQAGYETACTTRSGFNRRNTGPLVLRRLEIYGSDPVWKLSQKISFGINDASVKFPIKYYWNRALARIT